MLIALEPEAASVYCTQYKVWEFINESGSEESLLSDTLLYPNSQYMVVDIGGTKNEITRFATKQTRICSVFYSS